MGLSVTVLGCSGTYPGPDAACSGYLVRGGGATVYLDAGPGSLANLQRHIDLDELDAVVLSHQHADHWVELLTLYNAVKWYTGRQGVPVYGTAGTRAANEAVQGHDPAPTYDWHVVRSGSTITIGEQRWTFSVTDHYVETLAPRIDVDGLSLAYSADTGPGWSFSELGDDIDLAICESTHLSDCEHLGILHLSARQAGAMARESGVDRLVLTHLAPGSQPDRFLDEATTAFGGLIELATVHERYDL